jgi:hypothetical protein
MSRSFVWLPIPADRELYQLAFEICNNFNSSFFGNARMLPFSRNEKVPQEFDGQAARWDEVGRQIDDRLMILAHGMGRLVTQLNTDNIGWKRGEPGADLKPGDLVTWTYDKLAGVVRDNHDAGHRAKPIIYELLVCYGGNKFFGKDAFGAKLASSMRTLGLKGKVWAYKGGVVMAGGLPTLFTHGTSRITSRIPFTAASRNQLKAAIKEGEDGALQFKRFNYHVAESQREVYPIG